MTRPTETGEARDIPRTFRMTEGENAELEKQAVARGFSSASVYLRWLITQDAGKAAAKIKGRRPWDA